MSEVIQKHGFDNVLPEVVPEKDRIGHTEHVHQHSVLEADTNLSGIR